MSACGKTPGDDDDDDDDDDTTTTETEYKPIANNDFTSLYDTSDGTTYNPRVPKDWSFSGDYVDSSNKASDSSGTYTRYGTISVKDENFNANESKYQIDALKTYNKDKEDADKIKAPNPYTLKNTGNADGYYDLDEDGKLKEDDGVKRDDDKILMIGHLLNTATRYKSSSITVQANAILKISVRVYTAYFDESYVGNDSNPMSGFGRFPHYDASGDKILDGTKNADGKSMGATLSVTGGVEEPFTITGIDTNCAWQTFDFYIKGDASSSKTVYLELGLGSGNPLDRTTYTNGYAFFDNIETTFMSEKELAKANVPYAYTQKLDGKASTEILEERNYRTYADNDAWTKNTAFYDFSFDKQDLTPDGTTLNAAEADGEVAYKEISNNTDTDYKDEFDNSPFGTGFYAFNNVKTEGKLKTSDGKQFTLPTAIEENTYYRISIWLKTTDFDGKSGANLYLFNENGEPLDSNYSASLANVNTTTNAMSEKDQKKDENGYYKLNGWREYSFFVKGGTTGGSKTISMQVWFGPIMGSIQDTTTYPDIYDMTHRVMFTTPTVEEVSDTYYSSASSGENIATFDLSTSSSTKVTNGGFTNLQTNGSGDVNELDKVIKPAGWPYIGGLGDDGKYDSAPSAPSDLLTGVANAKNFSTALDISKNVLDFDGRTDNSALYMNAKTKTSFGYRSSSITIPANGVYRISIYGWTNSADAYIYLTDSDGKVVTVEGKKVKRDEDGKIQKDDDGNPIYEKDEVTKQELQFAKFRNGTTNEGWREYTFYIRTGAKAKTVTMELWLGSRFDTTRATGIALFDDAYYDGSDKTAETAGKTLTPDEKIANDKIDKIFEDMKEKHKDDTNYQFFDYMDLDILTEEDTTDTPDEEEDTTKQSNFGWLDIATLVMALALIFALGAVGIKQLKKSKFYKKRELAGAKKKAKNRSYDRKNARSVTKSSNPVDNGDGTIGNDEELELPDDLSLDDDEDDEEAEEDIEGSEFDTDLEEGFESDESDDKKDE